MGDVPRLLTGLEEFEVTAAVETAVGGSEVWVRIALPPTACRAVGRSVPG